MAYFLLRREYMQSHGCFLFVNQDNCVVLKRNLKFHMRYYSAVIN